MKQAASAALASPRFLYLYEEGAAGEGGERLNDFELASRLSFFLWGSIPDEQLLDIAERGRLILMAGREARPEFPVGPFYVKECSLHGLVMFKATADELQTCADDMNRWMSEGRLQAQIGKTLPLSEASAAHRLQEENTLQKSGTLAGKIVLEP